MRQFTVTLRSGHRVTVQADRVVRHDAQYIALILERPPSISDPSPQGDPVALFDSSEVVSVVSREHLISEEKGDPIEPSHVVRDDGSSIPF
jgi:hypothetical protein